MFTHGGNGNRSYCPPCNAAYQRDWRMRNRDACKRYKKKWETANIDKHRAYKRAVYHRDVERSREQLRRRRAANPKEFAEYAQRAQVKRRREGLDAYYKYGVTLEQRRSIEADQGGLCLLCDEPLATARRVCVDHEHRTGLVRGILCKRCNSWLGWCEPRAVRLADYLAGPHYRPARWDLPRARRDAGLPRGAWNPVTTTDPAQRRRTKAQLVGHYAYANYGVTPEQRRSIEVHQGGLCLLCDRPLIEVKAVIDHEHSTGLIRGVLCRDCNVRLGWYEARAGRIADYLAGPHYRPARWDEHLVTA